MVRKTGILIMAIWCTVIQAGYAQSNKDTTAMVKEFNKVMSFALQPYLYYTTLTRMDALPVLEQRDTASIYGVFYKNETNLYYKNGQDEIYLQDSLLVQINDDQKTIWIRKVDMSTRDNLNVSPLGNKKIQDLFRKGYTIDKSIVDDRRMRMDFMTKQPVSTGAGITTQIGLEYQRDSYQPLLMDMNIKMQEPASDELLAALKTEGIDDARLVQTIDGTKYVIRKQQVSISFSAIDTSREKAMQMPDWKTKLQYNESNGEFAGKGAYSEYERTKTF
jgi:hypothetical protein